MEQALSVYSVEKKPKGGSQHKGKGTLTHTVQGIILYITYFAVALPTVGRPNCAICIERYLAVLHPVTFLKCKPLRYRLACSAVIWLMVFAFGILCTVVLSSNNIYMFVSFYLPLFSVLLSIKFFAV